jgi:2-polyprenyl-3-methyl-5-hydroxy-6-metoxy-1,4-benzoquinol methylase
LLADEQSALSLVLADAGHDVRVLELGTSTGYMSRALVDRGCMVVGVELDADAARMAAAHCERMIVGDLDDPGLLDELGDDRFDVIVAADVLEHLKDPPGALKRAVAYLREGGKVVASLPNVAHVSVRIALLQGRFPYGSTGLLDHTHLQFYDRERLFELFERAGLAIVRLTPRYLDAEASTVPFERDALAEQMIRETRDDPSTRIYQYVVVAYPLRHPDLTAIAPRLHALAERAQQAERAAQQAERAAQEAERAAQQAERALQEAGQRAEGLQSEITSLAQRLVAVADSEAELRALLRSAHEQLAERDEALEELPHVRKRAGELEGRLRSEREAREYFEIESRLVHEKLEGITSSRAWRIVAMLRRVKNRLR